MGKNVGRVRWCKEWIDVNNGGVEEILIDKKTISDEKEGQFWSRATAFVTLPREFRQPLG